MNIFSNLIFALKEDGTLKSENVEYALKKIKRELFVPEKHKNDAYSDCPIPISHDQNILQPSVVVTMTEMLDVREGHKVLEVGAGSGWQAAILGHLVGPNGKVYTVEIYESLVEFSKRNIKKIGLKNVEVIKGDGTLGLVKEQPFDRIILSGAIHEVPPPLIDQIKEGGKIVAPLGNTFTQEIVLFKKKNSKLKEIKREGYFNIDLLIGKYGFKGYWS